MKVLVVQGYGLGNGVMTTPLVQSVASLGHYVDVLVEDNRAAYLAFQDWPIIRAMHKGALPATELYDVALYAHPMRYHRARVEARQHFEINLPPDKQYMWGFPKHEIEVLMDLARDHLSYTGEIPLPRKLPRTHVGPLYNGHYYNGQVAISVGYFKGAGRETWVKKHWGTANYIELCRRLERARYLPVIVGGAEDADDAREISAEVPEVIEVCGKCSFPQTCDVIASSRAFIGNDSGLMHVAAAYEIPTFGIFLISNPTKNAPWGPTGVVLSNPSREQVWEAFVARVGHAAK